MTEAEDPHLYTYERLTMKWPNQNATAWLDKLASVHGADRVAAALVAEHGADTTPHTLLGRTEDRLAREARTAEKRATEAAQQRKARERAEFRERVDSMPAEQRRANLDWLKDAMQGVTRPMPGAAQEEPK